MRFIDAKAGVEVDAFYDGKWHIETSPVCLSIGDAKALRPLLDEAISFVEVEVVRQRQDNRLPRTGRPGPKQRRQRT